MNIFTKIYTELCQLCFTLSRMKITTPNFLWVHTAFEIADANVSTAATTSCILRNSTFTEA